MPRLLSVEVRSVGELFDIGHGFRLPWFQRAYSWRMQQVARLVGDLVEAAAQKNTEDFLLGTLMLAKMPGRDRLAIVDGHQRIMTLTIIAAVLRDLDGSGGQSSRLNGLISNKGGGYKLEPQSNIAVFFEACVQRAGATATEVDESEEPFSDSERCVVEVREHLLGRLQPADGADANSAAALRAQLAAYLLDRCKVIVQVYDSEDYAWRILDIEETTRLPFYPGAQAKSTILGIIPSDERETASQTWERCEELIGTSGVGDVLGYVRILKSRKRSERPVEFDICGMFSLDRGGASFFREWFEPNVARHELLRGQGRAALWPEPIARSLETLNWIEPLSWMPAAMHWLSKYQPEDAGGPEFFRKLDRLAWIMKIAGVDPAIRLRRIISVLDELDGGGPAADIPSLAVEQALRRGTIASLRAQNFCLKHHAHLVLRRLSVLMGRDSGPVDRKKVTIEHMLPRNPDKGHRWWRAFSSEKDVKLNVNRIGNLTFLSHKDNQAAANRDWAEKRKILARSGFILSEQAAEYADWDRDALMARGEVMIASLLRDWDLPLDRK